MSASSAPTVKAALATLVANAVGGSVLVCYGHPGYGMQPDDIVSVGDVDATTTVGPMSTARRRDETLEISLVLSCFRAGGIEAQVPVTERAYGLLSAIYEALRVDPTVGGTCRGDAQIVAHTMREADAPEILDMGRVTEIVATVRATARI